MIVRFNSKKGITNFFKLIILLSFFFESRLAFCQDNINGSDKIFILQTPENKVNEKSNNFKFKNSESKNLEEPKKFILKKRLISNQKPQKKIQIDERKTYSKIDVVGNQRIDYDTIISFIDQQNLIRKEPDSIQKALKSLYETGLFSKIDILYRNDKAIIKVIENPMILDLKIVGNKKIDDEVLLAELSLKKREIFSKYKLENDLKRINEIYLKSGRFLTKIEPKLIQKENNRVEVVFDIFEGKRAKIERINFYGNEAFSDFDLREEISSKQTKWYKFLSSADIFNSDRIEYDKERLRRFYNSKGYADFTTISAISQINEQKDKFTVNFLVDEGIKYSFGDVKIINQIPKFDDSQLQKAIMIKKGKTYNYDQIEKTIDKMIDIMNQKSYAFADIQPILKRDKDLKIINIDLILNETPNIYIRNIEISGNSRTHNKVILREMRIKEGDPYNINKINRSRQLIQNLGFFEKVELDIRKVPMTNQIDIFIEVEEKKTGEMNLGVGYSTIDRLTTNIGVRERNLFGTGRDLSLNLQKSYSRISAELSYTKPYLFDYPIDGGIDIFNYELSKRNSLVYDQKSTGITLRAGYDISEYLRHNVSYSFRDETIQNIDDSASFSIKNLEGNFISSRVSQSFSYDKRDNIYNTKSGYFLSLSQSFTGIGGDIKNIKYEGSAAYYQPIINEDFILKLSTRGGYIDGIGQDVRSNYGFFLGGNNFRGFEYAGIGPRAKVDDSYKNGDIIGGKIYYVGTAEFQFPLGLPKEFGINGILFSENGTVYGVDQINKQNGDVIDSSSIRSSYGLSIVWSSPMGPIRLDFSKVAKKEDFDRTQSFRFSFGTNF